MSIEEEAFYHCKSLKAINIPNSVTSIKISAFTDCTNLETIKIPPNVTEIIKYAFSKGVGDVEIVETNCELFDITIQLNT